MCSVVSCLTRFLGFFRAGHHVVLVVILPVRVSYTRSNFKVCQLKLAVGDFYLEVVASRAVDVLKSVPFLLFLKLLLSFGSHSNAVASFSRPLRMCSELMLAVFLPVAASN